MIIQNLQHKNGYIFPIVILSVLIFSVLGHMLALRFSGPGAKEFVKSKSDNPAYEIARAGISRARFELLRPDNLTQTHIWTAGYTNTFTITIDGKKVSVTIEDTHIPDIYLGNINAVKVTATSGKGFNKSTIVMYYAATDNDKIGNIISAEVK